MKKVLILCTGNSCRSIIAEALVNKYLADEGIKAYSAGSNPSGKVNPNAKKVLEVDGSWDDSYYSKSLDEVICKGPFDLVVTVCDNAKESCPVFPNAKVLHIGLKDPDGKPYEAFVETKKLIKNKLLEVVKRELSGKKYDDVTTLSDNDLICYCKEVDKKSIVKAIRNGSLSLKDVKVATSACTGSECKEKNPNRRCCSNEINQLIQIYGSKSMKKDVQKTLNGVKISFTGEVKKENIVKMVENCATGQCECMSDATKKRIQNMEVKGEDGAVELELTGDIAKEEIEAALKRSKVLNNKLI